MNKILYAFVVLAALTSCAESYNIKGTSSVSLLDGSKLYLKTVKAGELTSIDSCEVVHGEFKFAGLLDSVSVVNLFMDDRSLDMPVVLEQGDISIRIDEASQKVAGTPLNEKLYEFKEQHDQLVNRMVELSHRDAQMLLDGIDEATIAEEIGRERAHILGEEDSLVTNFVIENCDNVLGPTVFVMMCTSIPQIEHIMTQATERFKGNPMVQEFYQAATKGEAPAAAGEETVGEPTDDEVNKILNGE
jgi:hypothetical protein